MRASRNAVPGTLMRSLAATLLILVVVRTVPGQTIFLTANGSSGDQAVVVPGDLVTVEVFIEGLWPPHRLVGYEIGVAVSAADGATGVLSHHVGSPFIDVAHPLFVFRGGGAQVGVAFTPPMIGAFNFTFGGHVLVTTPQYCGEFIFLVSDDALGNFAIEVVTDLSSLLHDIPYTANGVAISVVDCLDNDRCIDADPCTFDRCAENACLSEFARHGDCAGPGGTCGPDGSVDIYDILAVLDGFRSVYISPCTSGNLDIAGTGKSCQTDGRVDIFDILAVLNAFQGIDTCCSR